MSKSQHSADGDFTQNQNNAMSDDPGDGSRNAFKPGRDGKTPVERKPEHDEQDQDTIEAFGERGSGKDS